MAKAKVRGGTGPAHPEKFVYQPGDRLEVKLPPQAKPKSAKKKPKK